MRKPVRALCIALLAIKIRSSEDQQIINIDSDSEESMSSIQSDYIKNSGYILDKQTMKHPTLKLLIHKTNEPIDLSIHQLAGVKRPAQAIKENPQSKKISRISKASSINIDKIKKNISVWKNARLKNRHRECLHLDYRPAIAFNNRLRNNKYKEIGDEIRQSMLETHVKHCKGVYSKIPIQNEFWFAIAIRTSRMHTKLADCKAMNAHPSKYKFIEELCDFYPGLPGDIMRYMDKHGPIVSDRTKINTKWTETHGDIYIRMPIEPNYGIYRKTIICKNSNEYKQLATAVRMILGLSEVHKDFLNLTAEFIEKTLKEEIDSKHLVVVKALHEIIAKYKRSKQPKLDEQYAVLYNLFTDILHQTDVSYKSIVIQLYTEMYKSLNCFYEKAEVYKEILEKKRQKDEKKYYLLAGKCIIKYQKYIKCTTTVYPNKLVRENKHEIDDKETETDKWTISSDIEKHYHIHYVDNTREQYTRVCMPVYSDKYIHTISQTIEYLKKIYSIEKDECICPYTRNQFGYWEYIEEEERDKTVNDFVNCEIVFYYIEEGLRKNHFTFAEFESYKKPYGKTVRIPLFISPLMRSAVSMGPFEEAEKIKHAVISNIRFMCIQPSAYVYKEEYKTMDYSHIHHYYSNLYIRRDNKDVPTIDCYIMDRKATIRNNTITVEWYAKVANSADEYTHCILSDELINDQDKYDKFGKAVKIQEYTPDSEIYGFGLQINAEKTSILNCVGHSANCSIGQNNITDCKLSIKPIHKIPIDPKKTQAQYRINKLKSELEYLKKKIKKPEIIEEQKSNLKNKRSSIYAMKHYNRQKLKKIQSEDRSLIKEEFNITPFPPCIFFIVFRHNNSRTKSSLGAHNEILNVLTRRYNRY